MAKGCKEIDIAATLEHIRDQRGGMVQTRQDIIFLKINKRGHISCKFNFQATVWVLPYGSCRGSPCYFKSLASMIILEVKIILFNWHWNFNENGKCPFSEATNLSKIK